MNKSADKAELYEIRVAGILEAHRRSWFDGMSLRYLEDGPSGSAETVLSGWVADQAALHGILIKIRDLNLTLLMVNRVESKGDEP